MSDTWLPRPIADRFRKRINRVPSPILAIGAPWVTIMFASMSPTWPILASAPVLPPFGFMLLVAWRQGHPGLLPVWAGLPLGAFDDIYSGQPFGSAMLLWSLTMILLELVEARFPWRNFLLDWLVSAVLIGTCLVFSLVFANAAGASASIEILAPQAMTAIFLFPLAGRLVALFDRFRLVPFVELD
jgi:rod shape-determining protein MreD